MTNNLISYGLAGSLIMLFGLGLAAFTPVLGIPLIIGGGCFFIPIIKAARRKAEINRYELAGMEDEINSFQERQTAVTLDKEGIEKGWGNLVTFYYSSCYKHSPVNVSRGSFEVYKNGIKCYFKDHKFYIAKEHARIYFENEDNEFEKQKLIKFYIDDEFYFMKIERELIEGDHCVRAKFEKLANWVNERDMEKEENKQDYENFCNAINSYVNEGFNIISVPVDLASIDIGRYFSYKPDLIIFGRNNKTSEFLLYHNIVLPGISNYKAEFIRCSQDQVSYKIRGTLDRTSRYNPGVETSPKFSTTRAAVGYALAGPVGALALAEKRGKLPLGTYAYSYTDSRSVELTYDKGTIKLPFEIYDVIKRMYPEKEKTTFQQL